MKNKFKNWFTTLFILLTTSFYAQTKGISYQAVIFKPASKVLPGVGPGTVPLTNTKICLRFTFIDAQGSSEYQETITVTTDGFGIVNTTIGLGNQTGGYVTSFNAISWNTSKKTLVTELDISAACFSFEEISKQTLATAPFSLHAITADNITGITAISNGGTGASTVNGAKNNLGLSNVDNTSDLNKPISTVTQAALNLKANAIDVFASLALKENTLNKSTATTLGTSDVLFPTQNAVKSYVDSSIANATIADADVNNKGKIQLAGDLAGTAGAPTVPGLVLKENVANKSTDIVADATSTTKYPSVKLIKDYVDSTVTSGAPDATTILKGKIKLAGDLTGTADLPALAADAVTSAKIKDGEIVNADISISAAIAYSKLNLTNSIVAGDLTASSVTTAKLADDAVETDKIKNANVTNAKLDKTNIPLSGFGVAVAAVDLGNNKLINVSNPTAAQDAATKNYVDTSIANATIADADVNNKGKIQLAGDLAGTAGAPTVPGLALKENVANKSTDIVADATSITKYPSVKVIKDYVDSTVTSGAPDATTILKGKIKLAGDLTGTAELPALAADAVTSAKIKDGEIVNADISTSAAIAYSKLNLTNSIVAGDLTASSVTNAKLADDAVETDKIKNANVTNAKLDKTNIPLSGFGVAVAAVDLGNNKLINVSNPTAAQDAATKNYVDTATLGITTLEDGKIYLGSALNVATKVTPTGDVTITNAGVTAIGTSKVVNAMLANDAVTTDKITNANVTTDKLADNAVTTIKIADANVTNAKLDKSNIPLSGFGAATAAVDLGSNKLINVSNPTAAQDAATKNYVDTATLGITTLEDGKIYLGSALNVATKVTPTGDVTITNAGVTAIGTSKVVNAMLANDAVTTDKITNANVTTDKLADNAVTTIKIADANVTNAKLADNAVSIAKLPSGATATTFLRGDGTWVTPTDTSIYANNGTLVSDRTVSQETFSLGFTSTATTGTSHFTVDGTTFNVDAVKNNIGINTATPVSRLDINGSFGMPIHGATSNITLNEEHAIVRVNASTSNVTVTLPAASTATDRIYSIIKSDASSNKVIFSTTIVASGYSFTEVNIPGEYKIQSDGTNWYLLN